MRHVSVPVPPGEGWSYPIAIGSDLLGTVCARLQEMQPGRRLFVITDANVARAGHLETLSAGQAVERFVIDPPGETSKHLGTVGAILEAMEAACLGRDTLVVGLGGGTVGDIAGFVAAVFKRGVPVAHVPTTTVAQADSAIGGKTGVDSTWSKNAFGAFWHPVGVFVDVTTPATLDEVQYRSGLVESVKHALISDAAYFAFLEENVGALLSRDPAVLEELAWRNCRIKAEVVAEDPTEKNRRRVLNYGHTVGHAVESASGYGLLHGQAVAVGLLAAAWIEEALGLGGGQRIERIAGLLETLGMPLSIPAEQTVEALMAIMQRDKKALGGRPQFVVLEAIGRVLCRDGQWAQPVAPVVVEAALKRLGAR